MKPEVNTNQFEFAHGKKPRGQGTWAFSVSRTPRFDATPGTRDAIFWCNASYRAAKQQAQLHFSGEPIVYVLS